MCTDKLPAGEKFPSMSWNAVAGDRIDPAAASGWRALVIYRGKHCPLCKTYLNTLDELLAEFLGSGIAVSALSADSREQAEADVAEFGWKFPVGYDLSMAQMRRLGLYISDPRSPKEADHAFPEPALFVINPEGLTYLIDISNAPFARPDLRSLLKGLQFVIGKAYPIRGRA